MALDSAAHRDTALGSGGGPPRFDRTAQALHWLTALLAAAVLPLAWIATNLAKEDPAKPVVFEFRKSVGLTILALVVLRILWPPCIRRRLTRSSPRVSP